MKEYTIKSWKDFESKINLFNRYRQCLQSKTKLYVSKPLFRGQSNFLWDLKSTLLRDSQGSEFEANQYDSILRKSHNPTISILSKNWSIDWSKSIYFFDIDNAGEMNEDNFYNFYSYLIFLRHHDFPSPLLDWSQSPYVAAFFATQDFSIDGSIFVYFRDLGFGNGFWDGDFRIQDLGPNVPAHKRHYIQQAQYTFAYQKRDEKIFFVSHEKIFERGIDTQDYLIKLKIPNILKFEFLKRLFAMNINWYSLFQSDEGFVKDLWLKEQLQI